MGSQEITRAGTSIWLLCYTTWTLLVTGDQTTEDFTWTPRCRKMLEFVFWVPLVSEVFCSLRLDDIVLLACCVLDGDSLWPCFLHCYLDSCVGVGSVRSVLAPPLLIVIVASMTVLVSYGSRTSMPF